MILIVPPPYDHCVYLLSRRDHTLIYVGVTSNLFARLGWHAEHRTWWNEVALIQVESFETRALANIRETQLISTFEPFYNVVGSETGTTRHLDELRLATAAIRRARTRAVVRPQAPVITSEPVCVPAGGQAGVTLTEALPLINALGGVPIGIYALRTAAGKDRRFPRPKSTRGLGRTAAKVYDLEELRAWRKLILDR